MAFNDTHFEKALFPIFFKDVASSTDCREEHSLNAELPMDVTA